MKSSISRASVTHIGAIMDNLRASDKHELENPAQTMAENINNSEGSWTGFIGGQPVCMFGVLPAGILWFIGTQQIVKNARLFLRHCKKIVPLIQLRYSNLKAYVHPDNVVSVSWLLWLGFNLEGEENGFMRFTKHNH